MRYFVTIADRTFIVELGGEHATVDGEPADVEVARLPDSELHHVRIDGRAFPIDLSRGEEAGAWEVSIGGRRWAASAVDERTRAIREMAGAQPMETERTVKAPMPGLVVSIPVEVGQQVQAGDGVVIVEAMKMENELKAPGDGTVARIEVEPGQAVEKGAVLIVLE